MEENEVREINKVDGANGGGACPAQLRSGAGAAEVGRREGRVGVEEGPVRPARQRPNFLRYGEYSV